MVCCPILLYQRKEEITGLVSDSGSGSCIADFVGNNALRAMFPSIVGCPLYQAVTVAWARKTPSYRGDKAQSRRSILTLNYPIMRGIVTS